MPIRLHTPDSTAQEASLAHVAQHVRDAQYHCPDLTCVTPGINPDDAYEVALDHGNTRHLDAHVAHLAAACTELAAQTPGAGPQLEQLAAQVWDGLKTTHAAVSLWLSGDAPQQPSPRLFTAPGAGVVTGISAWLAARCKMRRARYALAQAEHAQQDLRRATMWWQLQKGDAAWASVDRNDYKSEILRDRALIQQLTQRPTARPRCDGLDDAALRKSIISTSTSVHLLHTHAGVAAAQGRRPYMEDFTVIVPFARGVIFGLFDGHGGVQVAQWATDLVPGRLLECLDHISDAQLRNPTQMRHVLKDIFWAKNADAASPPSIGATLADCRSGSTALVAVVLEHGMYIVNLGDSRAILIDDRGEASPLTFDQKPDDPREQRKLKANGAHVVPAAGSLRVAGRLAMSRSLGDAQAAGVLRRPQVTHICAKSLGPQTLLMGSDGIFDCLSNRTIARGIAQQRKSGQDALACAQDVVRAAYAAGSGDNVTAMVIPLDAWRR